MRLPSKEAWRAAFAAVRPSLRPVLSVLYFFTAAVLLISFHSEMFAFAKGTAEAGAATGVVLIEWVVSWPWWVWICLAILTGTERIAKAIKKEKAGK